jgi:methylmalonyl-CoA mutase C-terminal domain/subunit
MQGSRKIRILIFKTSLDGHWRGIAVVSAALRDAGMEVIYGGVLNPDQAVTTAVQEDVDVIGLNIGGGYGVIETLLQTLSKRNLDPLIVAGGTIPRPDIPCLEEMGIDKVFPPGSSLDSIVNYIKGNAKRGSTA